LSLSTLHSTESVKTRDRDSLRGHMISSNIGLNEIDTYIIIIVHHNYKFHEKNIFVYYIYIYL